MLQLNNNIVEVMPETLVIPAFKLIWDKDVSDNKEKALKLLTFIYQVNDIKSAYKSAYSGKELRLRVSTDLGLTLKTVNAKMILSAEEIYKGLQKTKSLKLAEAAESIIEQITIYFNEFTLENVEDSAKPDMVDKIMKNIEKVDIVTLKLETAKKRIEAELLGKGKGGRQLGKRELPKSQR